MKASREDVEGAQIPLDQQDRCWRKAQVVVEGMDNAREDIVGRRV